MTVRTEEKQSSFFADTRLSTRKTQRRERVPWALASHAPRVQGACGCSPQVCCPEAPSRWHTPRSARGSQGVGTAGQGARHSPWTGSSKSGLAVPTKPGNCLRTSPMGRALCPSKGNCETAWKEFFFNLTFRKQKNIMLIDEKTRIT